MDLYDFKSGKKRIDEILNNKLEILEKDKIPSDNDFTFNNGYKSWVTSIFVDIRRSSELFANEDKEIMAKIIRSFTSEVIEILRSDCNLREIGIRGDCVYAIYTTPNQNDIFEVLLMSIFINTLMTMLNNLLSQKGFQNICVGIGLSAAKELVVKAGRKDTGINNKVWIGKAVSGASNLSSLGYRNGLAPIVLSENVYYNTIVKLTEVNGEKAKDWFNLHYDDDNDSYYDANLVNILFNNWIQGGMKDE